MSDLTKRVVVNALFTPVTVIPFLGGIALLLTSEILGPFAAMIGVGACVFGVAVMSSNLLFNYEKIYQQAVIQQQNEARQAEEVALDRLDAKLCRDRDPRDQTALRNLRAIYKSFQEDLEDGKMARVPGVMLQNIDEIYHAVIRNLERQFDIWETSSKIHGPLRQKLLDQRDTLIEEIEASVETLSQVIDEVRALRLKTEMGELQRLQDRLHSQLEITRGTEARLQEFEQNDGSLDLSQYSEYEK